MIEGLRLNYALSYFIFLYENDKKELVFHNILILKCDPSLLQQRKSTVNILPTYFKDSSYVQDQSEALGENVLQFISRGLGFLL